MLLELGRARLICLNLRKQLKELWLVWKNGTCFQTNKSNVWRTINVEKQLPHGLLKAQILSSKYRLLPTLSQAKDILMN